MKSLTNVVFKNSKRDNTNRNILSNLSFIIVFVFLAVTMSFSSYIITKELMQIGQAYAFINILFLLNFFILFEKGIFEGLNVLYFSKDLKILLRMPIKAKDILHAKFLNMIISEYQMEIILLAIPMLTYGIFSGVNFLFYLYMTIILLILPIIPILFTALIIAVIMRFTNSIKNKNKAMYITIILSIILLGIMIVYFNSFDSNYNNSFQDVLLTANGVAESIADRFILVKPIMNTLLNYDNIEGIKNLIIYVLESIVCYVAIIFVISKIYLKGAIGATINSQASVKSETRNLELKDFKQKRIKTAYILKELKILIRTPIFNIQCIIMPIMSAIIMSAIMMSLIRFAQNMKVDILTPLSTLLSGNLGQAVFLCVGQIFYMMNFNSIIGISKERTSSKIMKYIPIKLSKQFNLKILIGVLVNIISSILLVGFYYYITHNTISSISMFIILLGLNILGEKFKLLIDIKNPKINWDNEYTMMKQNTNIMFELFYTLIIIGIIIILSIILKSVELFGTVTIMSLIIANIVLNEYMYKKQNLVLKKYNMGEKR